MDVRLPDGTLVKNVPDGMTGPQLAEKLKSNGYEVPAHWMQAPIIGGSDGPGGLKDFRAKFPQYADLSDDQLASAIHQKFYSHMAEEEFRAKIGMKPKAPAPPSASQHARDSVQVLKRHPLTFGAGMLENTLSGITSGAGSLADALSGSQPGAHDYLTYRPMTQAGRQIANLAAQESEKVGRSYDKVAGTGPLAQTLKERVPEALGAVGTVTGLSRVPKPVAAAAGRAALHAAGHAIDHATGIPITRTIRTVRTLNRIRKQLNEAQDR